MHIKMALNIKHVIGPVHQILVLNALLINEASGESAHVRRLPRAFAVHITK